MQPVSLIQHLRELMSAPSTTGTPPAAQDTIGPAADLTTSSTTVDPSVTSEEYQLLLQIFNQLPSGQVSLSDFFSGVTDPMLSLLAVAKTSDLQVGAVLQALTSLSLSQNQQLFASLNAAINEYQQNSSLPQFKNLSADSTSFGKTD